jgi:hypothetical protein
MQPLAIVTNRLEVGLPWHFLPDRTQGPPLELIFVEASGKRAKDLDLVIHHEATSTRTETTKPPRRPAASTASPRTATATARLKIVLHSTIVVLY